MGRRLPITISVSVLDSTPWSSATKANRSQGRDAKPWVSRGDRQAAERFLYSAKVSAMTRPRLSIIPAVVPQVREFIRREDGPTSVEYAVMLAMIIIVCISAISLVGGETFNFWDNNRTELESAFNGP